MFARTRSQSGLTIMELMITAVLIGIVAAMAVPRFHMVFERMRFRASNRELASTVRVARSKALTDKAPYGVYFNRSNLTVTLFKDVISPTTYTFESGDSVMQVDTLPTDFSYMGTDLAGDVLVFMPNGSARFTGGGHVITMATTESMVAIQTHSILASTGRIESTGSYY